jgi:hypothetical protein
MATLQQLEAGLRAAMAAGKTDYAKAIGAEIVKMRQPQQEIDPTRGEGNIARKIEPETWAEKNVPVPEGKGLPRVAVNALTAGTGIERSALNWLSGDKKWGDEVYPPVGNPSGDGGTIGNLLDPASWLIGSGVGKVLHYANLFGKGGSLLKGTAQNVLSGATTGGIIGGLSEDQTALEGAGIGAVAGGLIPLGAELGGMAFRGARNLVEPHLGKEGLNRATSRLMNQVTGDKRDAIIRELTRNRSIGQTAGQAAVPAGSAEFSGLQELASKFNPSPYRAIENSQQLVRRRVMERMAGSQSGLERAISNRSAAGDIDYGKAYQQTIRGDQDLMNLSENPYFKKALPDAFELAKSKGVDPKTNLTQFLHYVKKSLDDKINKTGEGALGPTVKDAVNEVKGKLVSWMEKKNPLYDAARQNWAANSVPINQMEVAGELTKRLGVKGGQPGTVFSETPGNFLRAVDDTTDEAASRLIKKSTGFPRGKLSDIMNPQQMYSINKVSGELQRDSELAKLASEGIEKTRSIVGDFSDSVPQTNLLSRPVTIANAIMRRMEGGGSEKIMQNLSEIMQEPQVTAEVMKKITPSQQKYLLEAIATRAGTIGAIQGAK